MILEKTQNSGKKELISTGYPMTLKRVINRNQLQDGDYQTLPKQWWFLLQKPGPVDHLSAAQQIQTLASFYDHFINQLNNLEGKIKLLAGDLRRLERDAVDEDGICKYIAQKTQIDENTVAAVLKEFMDF